MAEVSELRPEKVRTFRLFLAALTVSSQWWASLILSFALFAGFVFWRPEPWRLVGAVAFTVLVHVPLWFRKGQSS